VFPKNIQCAILDVQLTLNIEHYGYCRFTRKSSRSAIAAETLMDNAG